MDLKPKHLKTFWNRKNILFVSLFLIFAVGIGVTTAWLSGYAGPTDYNFQGVLVDCDVEETFNAPIKENVRIRNTDGTTEAYMRATYTAVWVNQTDGSVYPVDPTQSIDYAIEMGTAWTQGTDGYWYYSEPVGANGVTEPFIVTCEELELRTPEGYALQINVIAAAVQSLPDANTVKNQVWANTQEQTRPVKNQITTGEHANISVFTLNIRQSNATAVDTGNQSWSTRKSHLISYLNNCGKDILCLQEVTVSQSKDIASGINDDKYHVIYVPRQDPSSEITYKNPEGLMILYNYTKLDLLSSDMFWLSQTPQVMSKSFGTNYYRIAVQATFRCISTGKLIDVFNVHFDHTATETGKTARLKSMKLVWDKVQETPERFHVVAGDFNSDAFSGEPWYDFATGVMRDILPDTTIRTINKWNNATDFVNDYNNAKGPIDFIFVDLNVEGVKGVEVVTGSNGILDDARWNSSNYYSDHYAVVTNLVLKDKEPF